MKPLLGAHVSVAGGDINGIIKGEAIGAECIQIFGASPRSYAAALPAADAISDFKARLKISSIKSVYLHGAYLVNLGSSDSATLKRSIANLAAHLKIANLLGAGGLIFHVGSPNGNDRQEALERAAAAMKEVLKQVKGESYLVMENSGSVKKIGGTIAELEWLFKTINDSRVKICIDTAHALESGMIAEYSQENIKKLCDAWDSAVGIENLVALHANDSQTPAGSNHDRHENIGKGYIGLEGFKNLSKEKRLAHMNLFLEVPGYDDLGPDKQNMDVLKQCFDRSGL